MVVYRVPSVGLWGATRIGAAVSAAAALLPCLLLAFLWSWGVQAGKLLLDSWQEARVPVPVPLVTVSITMNFIDLLHMRPTYDLLIWGTIASGSPSPSSG